MESWCRPADHSCPHHSEPPQSCRNQPRNGTKSLIHGFRLRSAIPDSRGKINRGQLDCVVPIQPSIGSEIYSARIQYRHRKPPHVHIAEPTLALHPDAAHLPHVYPGNELCLYFPGEWQHNMLLAATIVPWTAEWLLHSKCGLPQANGPVADTTPLGRQNKPIQVNAR